MRFSRTLLLLTATLLMGSSCVVRSYHYRDRPTYAATTTTTCDPNYPCANTYYWDEWRGVYVFYDGYRYYDALGTPGTYPLPPNTVVVTYPPRGYVPPTSYRPPHGTYHPPRGYVPPPPGYHQAVPANTYGNPPPPNTSGRVPPPPPPGNSGFITPPPPNTSGRVPPPPPGTGGVVVPPGTGNRPPLPPGQGYVNPGNRPPLPPGQGGVVVPPGTGSGTVVPPSPGHGGPTYVPPPGAVTPPYVGPNRNPGNSGPTYIPSGDRDGRTGTNVPPPPGNVRGGVIVPPGPGTGTINVPPPSPGHGGPTYVGPGRDPRGSGPTINDTTIRPGTTIYRPNTDKNQPHIQPNKQLPYTVDLPPAPGNQLPPGPGVKKKDDKKPTVNVPPGRGRPTLPPAPGATGPRPPPPPPH